MSYKLGDIVTLQADTTFNGETLPLTGISGTVVDTIQIGLDNENLPTYRYLVDIPDITISSGTQTVDSLWLTEEEINGSSPSAIDISATYINLEVANNTINSSVNIIGDILTNIKDSKFSQTVGIIYDTALELQSNLKATSFYTDDEKTKQVSYKNANVAAEVLPVSASIQQEIAENIYAMASVLEENERVLSSAYEEESRQASLAMQDDIANFNVYMNTYILNESSENLLSPQQGQVNSLPEPEIPDYIANSLLLEDT